MVSWEGQVLTWDAGHQQTPGVAPKGRHSSGYNDELKGSCDGAVNTATGGELSCPRKPETTAPESSDVTA